MENRDGNLTTKGLISSHVSANVANSSGVDVLWHVVALVGLVHLKPLGINLSLIEEGIIAIADSKTAEVSKVEQNVAHQHVLMGNGRIQSIRYYFFESITSTS